MEEQFSIGDVVISLLGHDKNRPFLVVGIDKNGNIAIIDGRYRIKIKPKTKNPKHLHKIAHDDGLIEKFNSPIVTDAEIYKLIKSHTKKE